jgi:hypothetical protein
MPPNADPERKHLNKIEDGRTTADALALYDKLLPKKVRSNAVHAIEVVVTLSPEDAKRMGRGPARLYLGEADLWVQKHLGGEGNVLLSAIHNDETTTHLHVIVMPLLKGKLNARSFIGGGRAKMAEWQSEFAAEVGAAYGLSRGIPREVTKAKHKDPVAYARELEEREKDVEAREKAVVAQEQALGAKIEEVNAWLENMRTRISAELAREAEKTRPRPRTRDGGLER